MSRDSQFPCRRRCQANKKSDPNDDQRTLKPTTTVVESVGDVHENVKEGQPDEALDAAFSRSEYGIMF